MKKFLLIPMIIMVLVLGDDKWKLRTDGYGKWGIQAGAIASMCDTSWQKITTSMTKVGFNLVLDTLGFITDYATDITGKYYKFYGHNAGLYDGIFVGNLSNRTDQLTGSDINVEVFLLKNDTIITGTQTRLMVIAGSDAQIVMKFRLPIYAADTVNVTEIGTGGRFNLSVGIVADRDSCYLWGKTMLKGDKQNRPVPIASMIWVNWQGERL